MKNSNRDLQPILYKIIKDIDEDEFNSICASFEYFSWKYSDIIEKYPSEFSVFQKHRTTWKNQLREIKNWNELGVETMNKRLLQLCIRYLPKENDFFRIDSEIGSFTLPTRLDVLNKISLLARELVYDIFPRIENHINFKGEVKLEESRQVRGNINWSQTIVKSINRGEEYPLMFSCSINKIDFETPENILAVACLLKLKNAVNYLLNSNTTISFSYAEINILKNLKYQIENLLYHTTLKDMISQTSNYASMSSIYSRFFQKLEENVSLRIKQGLIKQSSYIDLLEWFQKFRGYNVRALTEKFTNFPMDHKESIDTMYELWIIFEMVSYFIESKDVQLVQVLKKDSKFLGFQLKHDDLVFNINYQYEKKGWTGTESNPDFTVQIPGTEKIPIVMDPKNWKSNSGEAIHKMLGYLMNLNKFGASIGILFFSYAIGQHTQQGKENVRNIIEKPHEIHGKELMFTTMVANPNDLSDLPVIFDKVFDYIKNSVLNSVYYYEMQKGESSADCKCPKCFKTATSADEIKLLFGFRNIGGTIRAQSWCRECRKRKNNRISYQV